jgi:hypothetical protein
MEIYIARDGQRLGPFSTDEVQRQLGARLVSPTDLAWTEGSPGWVPLNTLPELGLAAAGVLPPLPPAPVVIYHSGRTSSTAIASLVCGILSISFLPIVASIPAIILGHVARREIRTSGGAITGDGMAIAGLVLGYAYGALLAVIMLVLLIAAIAVPLLNHH